MTIKENNIKNLLKITNRVEGWLSVQEGVFLFKLAKGLPANSVIVEIGSWKGKSSIWLGRAIIGKDNSKVYTIDPHIGSSEKKDEYKKIDTFREFQNNVKSADLTKYIFPIRKKSNIASHNFSKKIDLLFIDGSHTERAAREDFINWSAKVKNGGWIIMHDATVLVGPWKVARKHILLSSQFQKTGMLGSMVFGQFLPTEQPRRKLINLSNNFLSYLFAMSYAKLRKIPFPKLWRKYASKANFKKQIGIMKS